MADFPGACLLIGVDAGSCEAIRPLASHASFALQATASPAAEQVDHWDEIFRTRHTAAIVVGTSDSARGRKIETAARLAATRRTLKVVAIEDYAGNYFDAPHSRTNLLIAESALSAQHYHGRLGAACPPIAIFGSARYDPYRRQLDALRAMTRASWQRAQAPLHILWAGQPESQDSVETLRRVAPAVRAVDATLLLKAHPRDPLHPQGVYGRLLDGLGVKYVDVSALTVAASLEKAPHLVLTQFSSVAIEAGFYGIPALHLVYHDVGGLRLQQKKGYALPLHCAYGASFALQNAGSEREILHEALFNEAARDSVIGCFDDFFAARAEIAPVLANYLRQFIGLT